MQTMKPLRIKDNTETAKELFSEIPETVRKIADKTLDKLEEEGIFVFPEGVKGTNDLTGDQFVLQSVNDSFRTGNVMGFLGYGNERLHIRSRFSAEENDFFLNYLLERVLDYPTVFDLESDANPQNRILDLLVFLFPRFLKSAVRKGLFKTYIRTEYNDSTPKGTIQIARHIQKNIPFTGNIAYSQREQSYDNYLTELVRHTVEYIKKKPFGRHMLSRAKDEVALIVEATGKYSPYDTRKILSENRKHVIRHAYFREYRALQRLCILILQHQTQEICSGTTHVYGVLFDGAWLWEEYVNSLVSEFFYHPMNKAGKGAQWLFTADGKKGQIYPDFIGRDAENRVIADAKYKPVNNIGNPDYFQMLAYMMRFDARRGMYFYPESGEETDALLWLNKGSSYESVSPREDICLIKHGFRIPRDASTYAEFSEKMQAAEQEFIEVLTELCDG